MFCFVGAQTAGAAAPLVVGAIFQVGGIGIMPIGAQKTFSSTSTDIYRIPVLPWIAISLGGMF
ncbi:MAG: hypothetical protein H9535_14335 [Ignavibacteria bacterium]|nr:hypothetical protein [Ignavibacteria bacterium]